MIPKQPSTNNSQQKSSRFEKTEPGFIGSLILTAEHILGQTAGTMPVIGLFIAGVGTIFSIFYFRKEVSRFEIGVRVLVSTAFIALGFTVIFFPFTGLGIGIGIAAFSLISNIIDLIHHKTKPTTPFHKKITYQKVANSCMSLFALTAILVCISLPELALPLLGTFIAISVIYLVYSFKDEIKGLFTKNTVAPVTESVEPPTEQPKEEETDKENHSATPMHQTNYSDIAISASPSDLNCTNTKKFQAEGGRSTPIDSNQTGSDSPGAAMTNLVHKQESPAPSPHEPTGTDTLSTEPHDSEHAMMEALGVHPEKDPKVEDSIGEKPKLSDRFASQTEVTKRSLDPPLASSPKDEDEDDREGESPTYH